MNKENRLLNHCQKFIEILNKKIRLLNPSQNFFEIMNKAYYYY